METALNLLWVGVAIAGLLVWRFCWSVHWRKSEGYLGLSRRFMALLVVLFILFPVISLSDDLQEAAGLVEDAGASFRAASKGKLKASDTKSHTPVVYVRATELPSTNLLRVFTGCSLIDVGPLLSGTPKGTHEGRAPPFTRL
jgi:hypothetical protein